MLSPNRHGPSFTRPSSVPPSRDRDYNRMHSGRSTTTPRRNAMDFSLAQGNAMKVYVRVRPFSERELSLPVPNNSTVRIDTENPCMITLLDPQKDFRPRETFIFTRCFWSVLERNVASGKTAGEIRDTIDTFLLNNRSNNISSPRVRSRQSNAQWNNNLGSGRSRNLENSGANFEGAGSNPAVVALNNVTHAPYSSQETVYNEVGRPILLNTLEGYNGCVFAYGQTGSGKTFTMLGYAPRNADFHPGGSTQPTVNRVEYDSFSSENPKPSTGPVSSARFRRVSAFSSQSSRHDNFTRQLSPKVIQSTEAESPLDVVDTTQLDPNELQGIIPRIGIDLFKGLREQRERDPSHSYRVEVEYYEIYNEKVYDLIRPTKDADLKVRQHPVSGPYVEGLATEVVANEEQIAAIIRKGSIERHTVATKINDWSSRSHAILTVHVLQLYLDENDNTCKKQSKLNLVDLAGSERTGAVGAEGKQFLEGTKINLSLTTLGRVIDCLADISQSKTLTVPAPYRDSNLTWLLMDSLGGNSKTSMIATISPHSINFDEMRQTIRYASRAKQIVNKAVINEDPQVRQIRMLSAEVDRLKKIIREAGHNEFSRDDVIELQRRNTLLEKNTQEKDKLIVELRVELENHGIAFRACDPSTPATPLKRQRGSETSAAHRLNSISVSGGENGVMLKTPHGDQKNGVEGLRRQITSSRIEEPISQSDVVELHNRIKTLTKELERLRSNNDKKKRQVDHFISFYMGWTSDLVRHTMMLKEDEMFLQMFYLLQARNGQSSDSIHRVQKAHREEMEQLRARHFEEMEELHNISKARIKESIEKSNEKFQQLIEKHMEKLMYVEKRMKLYKEFYDTVQKRTESEKENMRLAHEDQMTRERARFEDELRTLRDQLGNGANDRRRSGEAVKRMQENHNRAMTSVQGELDRIRREKDLEVSRLKQNMANESMRHESELLEKDKARRLAEQEANELRRELLRGQTEWTRLEKQQQNEIQKLVLEQEKFIAVCNALLSGWDNKSTALDTSFCQLRALVHSQDYTNFRARLRDQMLYERKDYTAELEAVESRKQRDTQILRDIVQQLKQNQEDSRASLHRFEQDVMQHLANATKPRLQIDAKAASSNSTQHTKSCTISKLSSAPMSPEKKIIVRKKLTSQKPSIK